MFSLQLARILVRLVDVYEILILVSCILTWVPRRPGSVVDDVAVALARLTEPWLGLFRRLIPPLGGIDFSPVVAIVALQLVERLILAILV